MSDYSDLTVKSLKPASHLVSKKFDQETLKFWKNIIEPDLELIGECYVENINRPDNVHLHDLDTLGEILGYSTTFHDGDFYVSTRFV